MGALSVSVMSSKPNVVYFSDTVGCLCIPAEREGPMCASACHIGTEAAGMGAEVGRAGGAFNTPVGEKEGAAGVMLRGESTMGSSGVGLMKV